MNDLPLVPREPHAATAYLPFAYVADEPSLGRMLGVVWAYRWLSLAIMLTVMAATTVAISLWPRSYLATAALIVDYEVTDPLNGKELPVGQVGSFIATQVELMQTPELVLAVVDRLELTRHAEYRRGHDSASGTLRDWAAAQVAKSLNVFQSQRGSQLIYVSFAAPARALAANVANTVIEIYQEQDAARSAGPPAERARRYAAQLAALKAKVDEAQRVATAFQQLHGLADDGSRTDVDVLRLASLDERLLAAQTDRRAAELRAARDPSASDEVLTSLQAQALQGQLVTAEQRLAQLNRQLTPIHPDVREAQQVVNDARRALAGTVRSYVANASEGRSVAQRMEQGFVQAAEEQRARVLVRGRLQDEAAKYRLELAAAQTVYQRSLEGYDQIVFATAGLRSNVSVVSRATPPVAASKPRVVVGFALGAAVAVLFGFGVPLLHERLNRRVRSRDDLVRVHGLPVLAEFDRLPMQASA